MSNQLQQIIQKQKSQSEVEDPDAIEEVLQLVGFIVGEEEFTVPILSIQEIIKPIEFTRVPHTPDYVLGVFNLRGTVIPLIDLRSKFGMNSENQTSDTRYIVMKNDQEIAGFVIDRLTEAIRLNLR
ncbi:MAG: chemotaxis protein CheW, partial [Thiovulaceae bacterium]|nr:chemotaxis protein CheW [Sulfurimonadaceae bacterium]